MQKITLTQEQLDKIDERIKAGEDISIAITELFKMFPDFDKGVQSRHIVASNGLWQWIANTKDRLFEASVNESMDWSINVVNYGPGKWDKIPGYELWKFDDGMEMDACKTVFLYPDRTIENAIVSVNSTGTFLKYGWKNSPITGETILFATDPLRGMTLENILKKAIFMDASIFDITIHVPFNNAMIKINYKMLPEELWDKFFYQIEERIENLHRGVPVKCLGCGMNYDEFPNKKLRTRCNTCIKNVDRYRDVISIHAKGEKYDLKINFNDVVKLEAARRNNAVPSCDIVCKELRSFTLGGEGEKIYDEEWGCCKEYGGFDSLEAITENKLETFELIIYPIKLEDGSNTQEHNKNVIKILKFLGDI